MSELLIALSDLPGVVPAGAPSFTDGIGRGVFAKPAEAGNVQFILVNPHEEPYALRWDTTPLDLSAPDPAGSRIDGLHVAAGMLARAMGHPEGSTVFWLPNRKDRVCFLQTYSPSPIRGNNDFIQFYPDRTVIGLAAGGLLELPGIAAVGDVDPADPNADRLAMIAIIGARPWEGR